MAGGTFRLAFEQPIYELEVRLKKMESLEEKSAESHDQTRRLRRELSELKKKVYARLQPWETVQVARHPDRPMTTDYIDLVFDDFVELHGDKFFGDDRAIRTGFAKLDQYKLMIVGHEKGRTPKQRHACNSGCAQPEGYRKAMAKMRLAAKFGLPIVCLIDTPGAFPGIGAEERGQAQVIADSMQLMSRLPVPIVCVVIGEGGSGGALGIGVGDQVGMLQHAYYSVISPEGCAGILWKSGSFAQQAAEALRFTSADLLRFGVIDEIIAEPLGGAHRDHHQTASRLKIFLLRALRQLTQSKPDELLDGRYQKFRRIGSFLEGELVAPDQSGDHQSNGAAMQAGKGKRATVEATSSS